MEIPNNQTATQGQKKWKLKALVIGLLSGVSASLLLTLIGWGGQCAHFYTRELYPCSLGEYLFGGFLGFLPFLISYVCLILSAVFLTFLIYFLKNNPEILYKIKQPISNNIKIVSLALALIHLIFNLWVLRMGTTNIELVKLYNYDRYTYQFLIWLGIASVVSCFSFKKASWFFIAVIFILFLGDIYIFNRLQHLCILERCF